MWQNLGHLQAALIEWGHGIVAKRGKEGARTANCKLHILGEEI